MSEAADVRTPVDEAHPHLNELARDALALPKDDRVTFVQSLKRHYVPYPRAEEALQLLKDLLNHPKTLRMPNLVLTGESGNGKSTILERFFASHPVTTYGEEEEAILPILKIETPIDPTETRFWSEVLIKMQIAHRDTDPVQRKKQQARTVLADLRTRMVMLDEFHNILNGHARQQRTFLAMIKSLSNELQIPLVIAGTNDAVRALRTDPQLVSRFEGFLLSRWQLDRDYLRLLASFEQMLPLEEPSGLATREMATKLHIMSRGTIGGLFRVLERATIMAIREGKPRIDLQILARIEKQAGMRLGLEDQA